MKSTALIISLALLTVPASALAQTPPAAGGVKCDYAVKKKYRLNSSLRSGIPVKVTCTGPATVLVGASFWGRKVRDYLATHYGHGSPGEPAMSPPVKVPAGTTTVRLKIRPWARGIAKRFAPFPIHIGMAPKDDEGRYRGFSNKPAKLVR
jgi:hypothetical protein